MVGYSVGIKKTVWLKDLIYHYTKKDVLYLILEERYTRHSSDLTSVVVNVNTISVCISTMISFLQIYNRKKE